MSVRRRALFVAVVAVLFLVPAAGVLAQSSGGGTPLGGYKLDARAQALNVIHDSPDSPSPTHPDFDGSVPAAQSTIDTGPLAHGLSSIFWPGPLGGNFGSALKQLGQVCAPPLPVPGLPPVCQPIPQQLKDNGDYFNTPVRAETFYPQAPQDAKYENIPGATMTSHVDAGGKKVESFGRLDGFGASGVGVISQLTAQTTSVFTDTTGTATATSEANGIVLSGGLVTIDKVTSTAIMKTDGQTATADTQKSGTKIEGLKIADQAATVDDQGVHIGGQSNPLHKQVNQAIAQALAKSGLKFVLVSPEGTSNGATGSFTAGALVIQYQDDKNTYVPGGIHNTFTIALGGATASVDSTQGFNNDLTDTTPVAPVDSGGDTGAVAGPDIAPAGLGDVATLPATFSAPRRSTGPAAVLPLRLTLSTFGLGWGLIVLAIIVAMGAAFGLRRLTDDVFAAAPASATCPLEEGPQR
jgi:hypothetical protein